MSKKIRKRFQTPARIRRILQNQFGMAVSLLEATAVIAVGAILTSAISTVIASKIQDARIANAHKDVAMIAGAVALFNRDMSFFPVFKSGTTTSSSDEVFFLLASADGDMPQDGTTGQSWRLSDSAIRDSIENHLILNNPGASGKAYPNRGQMSGGRGWAGPYMQAISATDPWGNKYLVNVQFMSVQGVSKRAEEKDDPSIKQKNWAVYVLSAGPNETVQTPFQQLAHEAKAVGDDFLFKLQ